MALDALKYAKECYQKISGVLRDIFGQYREPLNYSQTRRPLTHEEIGPSAEAYIGVLIDVLPTATAQASGQQQTPTKQTTCG